jgi:hypothetical protein
VRNDRQINPEKFREVSLKESVRDLLQQLGEAINDAILGSARIDSLIKEVRREGYEIYLMLEANIGVEDKTGKQNEEGGLTEEDRRFLKRLKIES